MPESGKEKIRHNLLSANQVASYCSDHRKRRHGFLMQQLLCHQPPKNQNSDHNKRQIQFQFI